MAIVPKSKYRVRIRKYKRNNPVPDPDPIPPLNLQQYQSNSYPNISDGKAVFYKDIPYGEHEKEKFDIFIPNGVTEAPLVVFFHGGGFFSYNKNEPYSIRTGIDETWDIPSDITSLLSDGIAFASVGYPLYDENNPEAGPRMDYILERMLYCIRLMKYHNETLKIKKDRFVLTGISAGSAFTMWAMFREHLPDLQSTDAIQREDAYIHSIAPRYTSVTDDVKLWESDVFDDYGLNVMSMWNDMDPVTKNKFKDKLKALLGFDDITDFYTPEGEIELAKTDHLSHINPNTNEFWIANYDDRPPTNMSIIPHHANFAKYLSEIATNNNVEHTAYYGSLSNKQNPESWIVFVKRKCNE